MQQGPCITPSSWADASDASFVTDVCLQHTRGTEYAVDPFSALAQLSDWFCNALQKDTHSKPTNQFNLFWNISTHAEADSAHACISQEYSFDQLFYSSIIWPPCWKESNISFHELQKKKNLTKHFVWARTPLSSDECSEEWGFHLLLSIPCVDLCRLSR